MALEPITRKEKIIAGENLEPITRMEQFLKKFGGSGGSGGGSGVQPDWNQNDDMQPDYVKNRPFYTGDPVETVLVEESTIPFSEHRGLYRAEFSSTFEATVGETYKVSWDGADYECICVTVNEDIPMSIGNLSIVLLGSDTGEPFWMGVFNGEGIKIYTADASASHTFSISNTVVPVVKIDKKYLAQPDWNQSDGNAADFVKNRPFYANSLVSVKRPGNSKMFWYKVSDAVPTGVHSVGASCSIVVEGERTNMEIFVSTEDYYAATDGLVFVALKDNVKIEGITFPKKGTYFAYSSSVSFVSGFALGADTDSEITWDGRTEEIKKLDPKYLPDTVATKSEVEAAQTTANAAQTTADKNKETLSELFTSVVTFTFDKQTSGRDTFVFNSFDYYKISDFNPATDGVISFTGTRESGDNWSEIKTGNNCVKYGLFIVVASAGVCSLPVTSTVTLSFTAPSAGLYAQYEEGNTVVTAGTGRFTLMSIDGLTIKSSTYGSTKKFRITVDDSGTISATEVT